MATSAELNAFCESNMKNMWENGEKVPKEMEEKFLREKKTERFYYDLNMQRNRNKKIPGPFAHPFLNGPSSPTLAPGFPILKTFSQWAIINGTKHFKAPT